MVPIEYGYTGKTFNYYNKNLICLGKTTWDNMTKYENYYPDLGEKSFCEVLIHETAHMSLNLARDKIYCEKTIKKEDVYLWAEDCFNKNPIVGDKRTLSLLINFLNGRLLKNPEALKSNAEHYAIFFVMFYTLCTYV